MKRQLLDAAAINRALIRIAHEIVERNKGVEELVFVGIATRGLPIASRLAEHIHRIEGQLPPVLSLDVTPYRDDVNEPLPGTRSDIEEQMRATIHQKRIVIVDDVLYTGRTVRAALDALTTGARPSLIQLAVLVDRGHRELPIRPDYVGKNIPTSHDEQVNVHVAEVDREDAVWID